MDKRQKNDTNGGNVEDFYGRPITWKTFEAETMTADEINNLMAHGKAIGETANCFVIQPNTAYFAKFPNEGYLVSKHKIEIEPSKYFCSTHMGHQDSFPHKLSNAKRLVNVHPIRDVLWRYKDNIHPLTREFVDPWVTRMVEIGPMYMSAYHCTMQMTDKECDSKCCRIGHQFVAIAIFRLVSRFGREEVDKFVEAYIDVRHIVNEIWPHRKEITASFLNNEEQFEQCVQDGEELLLYLVADFTPKDDIVEMAKIGKNGFFVTLRNLRVRFDAKYLDAMLTRYVNLVADGVVDEKDEIMKALVV